MPPCARNQPYSRTKHYLMAVRGKSWKNVPLVMFNVYLDDSGTSPIQRVAICSALIIPGRRIVALENEWNRLTEKEGFGDFHSSPCASANSESQFADWKDDKIKRVFSRVAQISTKYGVKAFSWAIQKQDSDECIPSEWKEHGGSDHYTWAVRRVLYLIRDWFESRGPFIPPEYIFDWIEDKSAKEEVERVMAQEESGHPGEYEGHYGFKKRREIPGLQCADLLAWSCFQMGRFLFENTPVPIRASESLHLFGSRRSDPYWLEMQTNTREQLLEIVARNERDIEGQSRRRAWFEKYKAKLQSQKNPTPNRKRR